jgi:hypothetical protein
LTAEGNRSRARVPLSEKGVDGNGQ